MWTVTQDSFTPSSQLHHETIFTLGNGYLCTRGALEEGDPGDRRATFIHGLFDDAPVVVTELVNAPDWLPLTVHLDGERFGLAAGTVAACQRSLDLRTGLLTRTVRWRSPAGRTATLVFERFASLADEHLLYLRCTVIPEFAGTLEFRAGLDGRMDNDGLLHWRGVAQGRRAASAFLHSRTRRSGREVVYAMRFQPAAGSAAGGQFWDVPDAPTLVLSVPAEPGRPVTVEKVVSVFTSRDAPPAELVDRAVAHGLAAPAWPAAVQANAAAWAQEWARSDVVIEGDDEAQLAVRFNLFQLLIAAPRHDDRVNIGAKTLSGFGYRGHAFWDTEIFMLPLFTYTAPAIARNLLDYRYHTLPAARAKAQAAGYAGAWFAWESADTGEEVTPTWVPDFNDKKKLARVWTGDLAIHISADVAYAAHQYWRATGDDAWLAARGAELILDTAKF
ncbi:MAG: glycoside hydrolase family 65 protein, partial [Anaerolineales bacterium]|nr:glycoside hydrolase family 65 protein [Anaerolineales bacterium]